MKYINKNINKDLPEAQVAVIVIIIVVCSGGIVEMWKGRDCW